MVFVTTFCIYKSTYHIYLFNNCKEKCTFSTRPRVLRDQISQEILVGIVIFQFAFQNLPLKLPVIQIPLQKLGRNNLYQVLNISYFSHFTSNISGQQCMGLEAALTWKPALLVWQRNYHAQTVSFKVSSQSRKSEFKVFSIVHLNIYNFWCTEPISTK